MRKHIHPRRSRRGAVATEFAFILPLLIALCLAAVDFGRYAFVMIGVGNAARVGAEWGATHRFDSATMAEWENRLKSAIADEFQPVADVDPNLLSTTVDVHDDSYGLKRIEVQAEYPFNTLITWPMIPRPLMLKQKAVMRRYR
jgi:Flp pilus assembly protein TadG